MCLVQADMDAEVVGIAIPRRTENGKAAGRASSGCRLHALEWLATLASRVTDKDLSFSSKGR